MLAVCTNRPAVQMLYRPSCSLDGLVTHDLVCSSGLDYLSSRLRGKASRAMHPDRLEAFRLANICIRPDTCYLTSHACVQGWTT